MKKIDKSQATQPENTKRDNTTFQSRVKQTISQKNAQANQRSFAGYNDDKVKEALKKLYKNCAYCECNVDEGSVLEVEHYRPKKAIDEDITHRGYYWLAWEWSNLVYACSNCNGAGGKGNQFPILGTRCTEEPKQNNELDYAQFDANSTTLLNEQPLLLHPEIDNPAEHFVFRSYGKIIGITQRGRETIRICNLNRSPLIEARKELLDVLRAFLEIAIYAYELSPDENFAKKNLKKGFDAIFIYNEKVETYTLFRKHIKEKIEGFLIAQIPANLQEAFRNALAKYHKNEL